MQNVEWIRLFESLCLVGPLTVDRCRQGTAQDHFCGTFGMVWWWQDFVAHVVIGYETWLHNFKPETKRQSMECHQANSVWKKKLKAASSVGKAMATIFWDMEGGLSWWILCPKEPPSSQRCTCKHSKNLICIYDMFDHWHVRDILLQHDNAWPRTGLNRGSSHQNWVDCVAPSSIQSRFGTIGLPSIHWA
jgi:hypothetical protein